LAFARRLQTTGNGFKQKLTGTLVLSLALSTLIFLGLRNPTGKRQIKAFTCHNTVSRYTKP
jgi:hypothetical protein